MSYMSPPESRSRVENIKKKFEATSDDVSTSNNENANFSKLPANKNTFGSKTQSSNGYKNNVSSKKKDVQSSTVPANEFPKKLGYTSPTIKTQNINASVKAERQISNPSGRGGHIRRSPAFRCDKIVKGRNVTGQTSAIRERPKSILDNRVKLFEDGESVKSLVKRLNTSSPSSGDPIEKPTKPPLQKQMAIREEETATNSGKNMSMSHVNNVQSVFGNVLDKTGRNCISDQEKSSTETCDNSKELTTSTTQHTPSKVSLQTPSSPIVPSKSPISSFLHKYEQDKVKLPLEIKRNVINRALEKSKGLKNINVDSYAKVNSSSKRTETNGVKCENGDVPLGEATTNDHSGNGNVALTDSLKAVLKSPLPPGPPPKKPPRTFAHNVLSAKSSSPQNVPSATASAMDAASTKDTHRHVKFTKSASADIAKVEKTGKPVRSKTESEIKLKKLESVLLNHQQGNGGIVLRPKSPMVKRIVEDKATATYDEPEIIRAKSAGGRVGPLPSLPSESELLKSTKSTSSDVGGRFGGCINLNCVSTNSNNPMYSQIHFYEKVPEKQSEFFISVPNKQSIVPQSSTRPCRYGTLLRSKSRSEEHIYAEPFEFLNKNKNHKHTLQHRRSPGSGIKSGESVGDLTKVGASLEELQKVTSSSSKSGNAATKTPVLHYLCTPISPENTTGTTENQTKQKVSESKIKELITPIMGRRASEPQNLGSDSEEKKKPSILRFAGLVRGGQSNSAVEGTANKVDRTKVQLLMNQAFGTPLQGLPTNPLELAGSDSDSMASTPDDGGFVMIFPETSSGSTQLTDASKAASKCIDASGDGEDSSSTNSVEQQEQMTRLSEERKADVPPHIEHLCFPDAKDWPPPEPTTPPVPGPGGIDEQSYSLVITNETGERRFGYCRRILAELESRHGQPEWLQTAFIKELYSCQFPGPGQGLRLSTTNTTYNVAGIIKQNLIKLNPFSLLEERDLTQLFSALPVPALLQLFGSLLLERKVILISNSLSRLSSCVEALQSILYPFSWQHTLIPVLPTSLLDVCLSPTPYIVGILRGRDASTVPGPIDESLMVDLDESRILQSVGDEASILPQRLRRCLKVALQLVTSTTQPRDASRNVLVSEAFVRMFVEVCGHYRNHIVTQQDGLKVFERESFIKAVNSQSIRLFLEWFTETAMFSSFIESHLETESDIRGDRLKDWAPFS
ncbi:hypothetical protein C0J52_05278 [Blattella germanica]|nr:hypothetical protein C0J52_05278 [Blattella germanica]